MAASVECGSGRHSPAEFSNVGGWAPPAAMTIAEGANYGRAIPVQASAER
jgi:hypothetical protein